MSPEELLKQLQQRGLLDESRANRVRRDALLSGDSFETVISKQHLVPDVKMAELKSELLKVPYRQVKPEEVDNKLFSIINEETARTYQMIPISLDETLLVAGMLHPEDQKAQDVLKFIARQRHVSLGVYLISYDDWNGVLNKYSPFRADIERAVQSMNVQEGGAQKIVSLDESGGNTEAPVIKIVADTFREAVASKASDIHIEPQEKSLRIRLRNDGDLHQVASLPGELAQPITSRVKVISRLKIDETRVPQDGRFRSRILDREIDFRVATFPTPLGEKVAIRVLDPQQGLKHFDDLPLRYGNLEIVKEGLEKPYGMVLVTGPTGSGKTTTLYAFLQNMNKEDVNIVSLEDPVEYFVSGVNQSQVHPEIGYDFASGLRQILRQDPDIVMVGEIRDNETAGLAVQAALTGHIVLSTLHTNNSAGVIPRLMDMRVEPFLLPVALNLMMAQRLLGLLCPDCKFQEEAPSAVQALIEGALRGVDPKYSGQYEKPYKIWHTKGCNTCNGKGIAGRMPIYEVLKMTPELESIISEGVPTVQKIMGEGKRQGMVSLRQDGVMKALDGLLSIEEVLRETEEIYKED